MFLILVLGALLTAPGLSQVPNSSCYIVNERMEQWRPCRPEESR